MKNIVKCDFYLDMLLVESICVTAYVYFKENLKFLAAQHILVEGHVQDVCILVGSLYTCRIPVYLLDVCQ